MKSSLLRCFVFVVALASGIRAAEPFRPFVLDLPPGSSAETVRQILGAPSATLGPDLWVYFEFSRRNPNAANPAFDTLVVAFAEWRVTAVKITDGRIVRLLLADHQAGATVAAAGKSPQPRLADGNLRRP